MKDMKNGSSCCKGNCTANMIAKFLGVLLLAMGINMLVNYNGTVTYLVSAAANLNMGQLTVVSNYVVQAMAYSWPVVATLVGLCYLFSFKKCLANKVLLVYLMLFVIGHILTGDITGATWALLFAMMVFLMKGFKEMGKMASMCEVGGKKGK